MVHETAAVPGAFVRPADPRVYANAGIVQMSGDGYTTQPRSAIAFYRPDAPNRISRGWVEVCGQYVAINSISESTGYQYGGAARFQRVADPDDAAKSAYYMRINVADPSMPQDGEKQRVEMVDGVDARLLKFGQRYWLMFGFRAPAAWKNMETDLPLGMGYGSVHDEVTVFQVHETKDAADAPFQPPLTINLVGGNVATPHLSALEVGVRSSPLATSQLGDITSREVMRELNWAADTWQLWVIDARWHWDAAQSPHLRAYRRIGQGPWAQVIDDSQPNCYNDTQGLYAKQGIYYFAHAWRTITDDLVMHSKGLHVFEDAPEWDLRTAQDYIAAI